MGTGNWVGVYLLKIKTIKRGGGEFLGCKPYDSFSTSGSFLFLFFSL